MDMACRLAAERRARIVALNVVEVPLDQALTDRSPELEAAANSRLDQAVAIGDSYGVRVLTRLERAHAAGPAIVAEADCPKRRDHRPRLAAPEAHGAAGGGLRQDRRLRPQARELSRARHRCGGGMKPYSVAVIVFAALFVAIGVALLVRTAAAGGGVVGYVLGALFVVLGVARFTLERKRVR